jgi:hypothetical protein
MLSPCNLGLGPGVGRRAPLLLKVPQAWRIRGFVEIVSAVSNIFEELFADIAWKEIIRRKCLLLTLPIFRESFISLKKHREAGGSIIVRTVLLAWYAMMANAICA